MTTQPTQEDVVEAAGEHWLHNVYTGKMDANTMRFSAGEMVAAYNQGWIERGCAALASTAGDTLKAENERLRNLLCRTGEEIMKDELAPVPHEYIARNLGHSATMCTWCGGTPAENAALGEPVYCSARRERDALARPAPSSDVVEVIWRDGFDSARRCVSAPVASIDLTSEDESAQFRDARTRLAALASTAGDTLKAENERGRTEVETYASWQQKRGMLFDKVDWAINEYDEYMKDDAYDAQRVLDRIIERLRETVTSLRTALGSDQ